ncbi:MAG: hypothetical protein NTX52_14680 [Planctomycetota bacterium]|nr:hypothetical protein [Planctomycetota bacterium]
METKAGLLLVFVVLALSAATTNATIVTIGLTGEITYSEWSIFHVGDIITGNYTYDTDTPDQNPSPTIGHYQYSSSPYGVSLSVNGFILQTDPDHVDFLVGTLNDENGRDSYGFISYNNQSLPNDIPVWHIALQLDDYSGTALYSDALPTEPPVVGDWESIFGLMITFGYKGGAGV